MDEDLLLLDDLILLLDPFLSIKISLNYGIVYFFKSAIKLCQLHVKGFSACFVIFMHILGKLLHRHFGVAEKLFRERKLREMDHDLILQSVFADITHLTLGVMALKVEVFFVLSADEVSAALTFDHFHISVVMRAVSSLCIPLENILHLIKQFFADNWFMIPFVVHRGSGFLIPFYESMVERIPQCSFKDIWAQIPTSRVGHTSGAHVFTQCSQGMLSCGVHLKGFFHKRSQYRIRMLLFRVIVLPLDAVSVTDGRIGRIVPLTQYFGHFRADFFAQVLGVPYAHVAEIPKGQPSRGTTRIKFSFDHAHFLLLLCNELVQQREVSNVSRASVELMKNNPFYRGVIFEMGNHAVKLRSFPSISGLCLAVPLDDLVLFALSVLHDDALLRWEGVIFVGLRLGRYAAVGKIFFHG